MSEENLSIVHKYETDIDDDGTINIPKEIFKELKQNGFEKVNIVVMGSSKDAAVKKGFDDKLFLAIKKIQSLPDLVIFDFLDCKGQLSNTNFYDRFDE